MFVDVYTEDRVFMWLQLEPFREDLEPIEIADQTIGDRPKWLDEELSNDGWNSIIQHEWCSVESGEGWIFSESWFRWMLHHGLVPFQPFLVSIEKPEYHAWQTMDGWDCDVDYDHELVAIHQISSAEKIRALDEYMKELRYGRDEVIQRMRALREKRKTDKSAMYISYTPYFHKHYDEMCPPDGIQVSLCSRHTQVEGVAKFAWPELAVGRSDTGDIEAAKLGMKKSAKKYGIKLTKRDWEKVFTRARW